MKIYARMMVVVLLSVLGMGCSGRGSEFEPERYPVGRTTPPEIKVVELTIPRSQLQTALEKDLLTDKLRVIEVYTSQEKGSQPLYRLFDIHPASVYALLGLRNADVLVAANERYLRNATVFKSYVRMLKGEQEAQIEIMRGVDPLLYRYRFTD